jgi:hypothetical protein
MSSRPTNHCMIESLKPLVVSVVCVLAICAQEKQQLPAPPPMRAIPEAERIELGNLDDTKARIRRTVELGNSHLQRAEELAAQQKYDQTLRELGIYLALFDNGLKFLNNKNSDRGKMRDLYKRLELALRADGPRLMGMRRNVPLEYAVRMKEVEESARDGREEALSSFYGNTVLRDGRKKPDADNKSKDNSNKP